MPANSVSMIKITLARPSVTSATYNYLTNKISVTFSQDVSNSLASGDITVTADSNSASVAATYAGFSGGNTATFTLPNSMADGWYHVNIPAAGITDGAGTTMAAAGSTDFFVLAGDTDHDGDVDNADFASLFSNFGKPSGANYSQGDFDRDGDVDNADFAAFFSNFGKVLGPQPTLTTVTPAVTSAAVSTPIAKNSSSQPTVTHVWQRIDSLNDRSRRV